MPTIKKVEDIEAWKKARELTRAVYNCSKIEPFSKDFALRDQMRRAAVSVMSNIAEGFERGGTKEFVQFLAIAKGSAGEVEAQLFVALRSKVHQRGRVRPSKGPGHLNETAYRRINELLASIRNERGKVQRSDSNSEPGTLNPELEISCLQNSISSSESSS